MTEMCSNMHGTCGSPIKCLEHINVTWLGRHTGPLRRFDHPATLIHPVAEGLEYLHVLVSSISCRVVGSAQQLQNADTAIPTYWWRGGGINQTHEGKGVRSIGQRRALRRGVRGGEVRQH